MIVIRYTSGGQERSYQPSARDVATIERVLNDNVGIPAEPGVEVLAFVCYLFGEDPANVFFSFDGLLDWEEMFETDPIEWFNNVINPILPDADLEDVVITDIDFSVAESKKGSLTLRKLREAEEAEEKAAAAGKIEFTAEELQLITNRIWVESQWGEDVYEKSILDLMNKIIDKIAAAGINVE